LLTRSELRQLTDYDTRIMLGFVSLDSGFTNRFTRLLPDYSLSAVRRDAGGISATVSDVMTVAQAIATLPFLYNLLFGTSQEFYSGSLDASSWSRSVKSTLREHKIRQACSMVSEALASMADRFDRIAESQDPSGIYEMPTALRHFSSRFSSGPDPTTGCILSSEEAAWWGADRALVWNDDETQLVEVRQSEFGSIFDLVPA